VSGVDSGTRFARDNNGNAAAHGAGNRHTISTHEANEVIRRVTDKWSRGASKVSLVPTFEDLSAAIKHAADEQNAKPKNVEGVFHRSTIYLVQVNLPTAADVERTLFHEA